jgi:hypothetical protein
MNICTHITSKNHISTTAANVEYNKNKKTTLFETGRLISYVCARYNIHFPHIILFTSFPYIDFHTHFINFLLCAAFNSLGLYAKQKKYIVDDSFAEYLDSHRIYSVSQSVIQSVRYLKKWKQQQHICFSMLLYIKLHEFFTHRSSFESRRIKKCSKKKQ